MADGNRGVTRHLLFDLWAPRGSWGGANMTSANAGYRETRLRPAKAAVCGFIANAMGLERQDVRTVAESVSVAVRVDVPAKREKQADYHTVSTGAALPNGRKARTRFEEMRWAEIQGRGQTIITKREYWHDGGWTVAVSAGDDAFLRRIEDALRRPMRPLYVGSVSCPIGLPPDPETVEAESLAEAMAARPPAYRRLAELARYLPRPAAGTRPTLHWEEYYPGAPADSDGSSVSPDTPCSTVTDRRRVIRAFSDLPERFKILEAA